MDWSQVTFRKIRGLILFTILILVGLWNYERVLEVLKFIWGLVIPFVLGGAIAFIINVPMSFLEAKLFGEDREKRGKAAKKLARPVSLLLTLALVIGVIVIVMFVLVPQLGETFKNLGDSIAIFIPKLQEWIRDFTNNNSDVMKWVDQIEFNPDKMISWGMNLLGTGAGNVMNSTFNAVSNIISGITKFFIAFSFACYILFQKEKLHIQVRKVFFAFIPRRKAEAALEVCSLTYKIFSSFLTGQCLEAVILGSMFVVTMSILRMPYALLIGIIIAFTALIPIFGAFIGCALHGESETGGRFHYSVSGAPAGRRKSDLPARCWKFRGTSFNLGTGSSQCRRKSDGCCRNVDLYPDRFSNLYIIPGNRISRA